MNRLLFLLALCCPMAVAAWNLRDGAQLMQLCDEPEQPAKAPEANDERDMQRITFNIYLLSVLDADDATAQSRTPTVASRRRI